MTRKDYVAIANCFSVLRSEWANRVVQDGYEEIRIGAVWQAARLIAEMMSRDNPRFDRERFLKACGVQS